MCPPARGRARAHTLQACASRSRGGEGSQPREGVRGPPWALRGARGCRAPHPSPGSPCRCSVSPPGAAGTGSGRSCSSGSCGLGSTSEYRPGGGGGDTDVTGDPPPSPPRGRAMRPLSCWASGSLRPGCRPPRGQPCVLQPAASLSASVYSQVGQGDTQPRWSGGLDLASARAGRGWAGGARLGEGRKHRVVAGCTPAPSTASRTLGFSPGDPGVRPLQCSASPRAHLLGGEGRGGPGPRGEPRGWTGFVDASVTKSRTSPCGHGNPAAPALLGPTCPETGASGRDVGGPLGREACAVRPPGWSRSCSGRCRGCGRGRRSRSPCSCCRVRLCAPACPG